MAIYNFSKNISDIYFVWNKSDFCWINASWTLTGSRPWCGSSANWPLYVRLYKFFGSLVTGKSVSEIRGRSLVLSWIVNSTLLPRMRETKLMMMMNGDLLLRNGWPTKGVRAYFQPGPLSEILNIANLRHAANRI